MKIRLFASLIALISATALAEGTNVKFAAFNDVESAFASHDREIAQLRAELAAFQATQGEPVDGYAVGGKGKGGDCCCGGYYGVYENVIVKPFFSRSSAYFLDSPAPLNEGQNEVSFDWDLQYSGRIELGYRSGCDNSGARVRYWRFDNDVQLNALDPDSNIWVAFGDDSIDFIGIDDASDVDFSHALLVDVIDLEMTMGECNRLYSAGVRYLRMQQTYRGVENAPAADEFFSRHDFEGLGLTTAAEFSQPGCNGLTFFANFRASLMYGKSDFLAVNVPTTAAIIGENDADLLGIGEAQLGVDWRTCLSSGRILFVTAAAEAQYWMNAGTGAPGNNAVYDEGNYQNSNPQDADMGFFGLTIGAGLEY